MLELDDLASLLVLARAEDLRLIDLTGKLGRA